LLANLSKNIGIAKHPVSLFVIFLLIYPKGIVSDIRSNMDKYITSCRIFFKSFFIIFVLWKQKIFLSRRELFTLAKINYSLREDKIFLSRE